MTVPPAGKKDLLAALPIKQKVDLLTGADAWKLHGAPVIGLRAMVLSDGPAGVRGTVIDGGDPSTSLPCPVALGATWDERLVREIAGELGAEARAKGVDVLLGPTINIIRTPLAGRGFECFSEDPVLTARMAVAYVRGLRDQGVEAAAKHYVGNDSETGRRVYDARISERVLRELYLVPFEACVTEADVAMVMAAYNSVNGGAMTANLPLIREVLKKEWKFHGVVVSDWNATRSTVASALAGLDLVMPGPGGPWGERLLAAVEAGEVPAAEIDDKVSRLLRLARRVGALAASGDGDARQERSDEQSAERLPRTVTAGTGGAGPRVAVDPSLLRRATARSFILLRNEHGVLPLDADAVRSVAVIGPNAIHPQTQGGGSVRVLARAGTTPAQAIRDALGDGRVRVREGCRTWATVPAPPEGAMRDPVSGRAGLHLEVRAAGSRAVYGRHHPRNVVTWWDDLPETVGTPGCEVEMRAVYRATASGPHLIGAAGAGNIWIDVDGARMAEATTLPPAELVEAMSRPPEVRVPVQLHAGQEIEVRARLAPAIRADVKFVVMRLGIAPAPSEDELLAAAVDAARQSDAAIVVVGSAEGTESEGYDRDTMALPGRQDELVSRVAAVNPNTIVAVNAGMPMLMNWADQVAALLHIWLPGEAMGEALADVLFGAAEPAGRLPVTVPRAEADAPVLHAHPQGGELPYTEGLLVGYRGYDRRGRQPLFCFGHGLGYAQWEYEEALAGTDVLRAGEDLPVTVRVRNTGERPGREVIQAYLEEPGDDPGRPLRALAAFAAVSAAAGEGCRARLTIPARAFARYDEAGHAWRTRAGRYTVHIGRSSRDLRLRVAVRVPG